jgi:hypothetical protein
MTEILVFRGVEDVRERTHTQPTGFLRQMTVHVSNPAFVHDLLASLRRANYDVSQTGETTVEVNAPATASAEQARLHLGFYLANWRARHPGIVADIVQ